MSIAHTATPQDVTAENEWTIMVFFAGDQDLSPSMTTQLKAIKDAGFEKHTSVLIHYDPNKRGVGTVTFDINQQRKKEMGTSIGDGKDPFVRNLKEDIIVGAPKGATATRALQLFLDNGLRNHTAKHYVVVLVGHGVVVGNDAFLPDTTPDTAITLKDLGSILSDFSRGVELRDGTVELIGLHSCSMSALEVVYELKGAANYLIATEGVSFVGSWPYRQLLKKILNAIDVSKQNGGKVEVARLIMSLQRLCLHNSTDFMFSGLSADLCLCSLQPEKLKELDDPLKNLTKALKKGLKNPRGLELITLAHLKAQSYFQESYTDLYDFCLCLERECKQGDTVQEEMTVACKAVRQKLEEANDPDGLIVRSDFFGPLYQYSHGLSVFFPWSRPIQDVAPLPGEDIMGRYKEYKFTKELGDDSWMSFLEDYFTATLRKSRAVEDNVAVVSGNGAKFGASIPVATGSSGFSIADSLEPPKSTPPLGKVSHEVGCGCSVKNYPMEFTQSPRAAEDPNMNGSSRPQPSPSVAVQRTSR